MLELLDLAENKVCNLDTIDELGKLENLQTLNLDETPLMVHRNL